MATATAQPDIDTMTLEEIEAECDVLLVEMAQIRAQVEEARGLLADEGVAANRDWYRRATTALRLKGARHQKLLRQGKALRAERGENKAMAWQVRFINEARRTLKPETFQRLLDAARSEP